MCPILNKLNLSAAGYNKRSFHAHSKEDAGTDEWPYMDSRMHDKHASIISLGPETGSAGEEPGPRLIKRFKCQSRRLKRDNTESFQKIQQRRPGFPVASTIWSKQSSICS